MRLSHSDVFVRATVIEPPAIALAHESFHEHYVRNLSDFLPFFLGLKNGRLRSRQQLPWIALIKQRPPNPIHQLVVSTVVDQQNPILRHNRRGPGSTPPPSHTPPAFG